MITTPANFPQWLNDQTISNVKNFERNFNSTFTNFLRVYLQQNNYLWGNLSQINTTAQNLSLKYPLILDSSHLSRLMFDLGNIFNGFATYNDSILSINTSLIKYDTLISGSVLKLNSILNNASKSRFESTYNCSLKYIPSIIAFANKSLSLGLGCLNNTNFSNSAMASHISTVNSTLSTIGPTIQRCTSTLDALCFIKVRYASPQTYGFIFS